MKWVGFLIAVFVLICGPSARAVVPGGIYPGGDKMTLLVNNNQLSRRAGVHLVRGMTIYHGRKIPFAAGVFLPPVFFASTQPMPIVVALHNRYAIGNNGGSALFGEGMGRLLAYGGEDPRAQGDKAQNPIAVRKEAQFIGVIPQCPVGFGWESPAMADLISRFVDRVITAYHGDKDRVYLTGFSYGASSTWRVALLEPDRFAAIIVCDGRATPDPVHDVAKLKNVAIYLEVGEWDGQFVEETDRMHQALDLLPHRDFVFRMISGGNHFIYQTVYDDPEVWKWLYAHKRHS